MGFRPAPARSSTLASRSQANAPPSVNASPGAPGAPGPAGPAGRAGARGKTGALPRRSRLPRADRQDEEQGQLHHQAGQEQGHAAARQGGQDRRAWRRCVQGRPARHGPRRPLHARCHVRQGQGELQAHAPLTRSHGPPRQRATAGRVPFPACCGRARIGSGTAGSPTTASATTCSSSRRRARSRIRGCATSSATIGHASSVDLVDWAVHPDALGPVRPASTISRCGPARSRAATTAAGACTTRR